MSAGHADRQHATLSPSAAHRWLECTPSARLEAQFPASTSEYAEEGTLAHELCELFVRSYTQVTPRRTRTAAVNKLKKRPLWSDEMLEHAETYLEYVKGTILAMPETPHIIVEKRVDISEWAPGCFGTADCIIIGGKTMHVIDFKYGKGVPVSADHNPQLQQYALGAYAAYSLLYPIEQVTLSIVQPRLSAAASTWSCTIDELLQFGEYVKAQASLADKGEGDFKPSDEACRFCRAKQTCRARADHNVRLAFEKKDGKDVVGTLPNLLSLEEVGKYLQMGTDVAKWLDDLKEYALSQALAGNEVAGWKAVEGRGSREWTDQDEAFAAIIAAGTPEAMLYERNALSLARIEKQLGRKQFEEVAGQFVEKKPGKPALVPESDKREAITNKVTAADAFAQQ